MSNLELFKLPAIGKQIGVTRNTVYNRLNLDSPHYDLAFLEPFYLNLHLTAWVKSEINASIQPTIANRDSIQADSIKRQAARDKPKIRAETTGQPAMEAV